MRRCNIACHLTQGDNHQWNFNERKGEEESKREGDQQWRTQYNGQARTQSTCAGKEKRSHTQPGKTSQNQIALHVKLFSTLPMSDSPPNHTETHRKGFFL
jgi:hypothetical protein